MERIRVLYRYRCPPADADRMARSIALEQTVEVPEELVDEQVRAAAVGEVEGVRAEDGGFEALIAYRPELAGGQLPQLLNLLYGNVSIQKSVRVADFSLPEGLLGLFKGPNHGIPGLRRLLGVWGRPLLATAVKPSGAPLTRLAALVRDFALAGGDIVKDDQNLVDASFEAFKERVGRCQEAVNAANRETGRGTLYCPILTAPHEEIDRRLGFLVSSGVRGVLVCPMLIGFDRVRAMAENHPLVFLAHPSLTGTFFQDPRHGMEPGLLLGRLFRLLGADASIFPNAGGRFSFTRGECQGITRRLREPWGSLAPAFPAPAGGMRFENLQAMAEDYGEDAVFLVGGALLAGGQGVRAAATLFLEAMRGSFKERLGSPA